MTPAVPPTPNSAARRIDPDRLRWRCDPSAFPFETTDTVAPIAAVVGQDAAVNALRFGLKCRAHGQNIFVRGLKGTGRMTLIRRLLEELHTSCSLADDRTYVTNFADPMRPRLVTLPRGVGADFVSAIDKLVTFISHELPTVLESEPARARMQALEDETSQLVKDAGGPLESALAASGLALVTVTTGEITRPAVLPRVNGEPMAIDEYTAAHAKGDVAQDEFDRTMKAVEAHRGDAQALQSRLRAIMSKHIEAARGIVEDEVRGALVPMCDDLKARFESDQVSAFLDALLHDLMERHARDFGGEAPSFEHYRVNPVHVHEDGQGCPIVVENAPTFSNLIGGIDRRVVDDELRIPDHMSIRKGSLLEADGGFLILEVRDVLAEAEAWRALIRTLRSNRLEISPPELPWATTVMLKPEAIPVDVKVVLLGDTELFYLLDELDEEFGQLFKVIAEFDSMIPRSAASLEHYAAIVKRIADDDDLAAFSREAMAALVEHGARIAASKDKLTARFSRVADIAREAAFIAQEDGRRVVSGDDVQATVRRTKERANLSSRRFRELLADGIIQVDTDGAVVGQINGLAVMRAGQLTYGFPARITASIGPGSAGVVNIERESALSGAIHTKGFYILAGLLRNLLAGEHPLTFEAALAFEQSYGGIDGDSASGAEMCCLLSALTRVPIRQDLAMTGAIDQLGHLQAIGGVNEKIEGFFDTCLDRGLTVAQGVVIPRSNVGDLMLRTDVVEAARANTFHVYAASTIGEALELMTGRVLHGDDPDSLISIARERNRSFWQMACRKETS